MRHYRYCARAYSRIEEQDTVEGSRLQTTIHSGASSGDQFTSLDTDTAPEPGSSGTSAANQYIFIGIATYHRVASLRPKSLVRNFLTKSPNLGSHNQANSAKVKRRTDDQQRYTNNTSSRLITTKKDK
jgi:hypothetical protein